eukprot:c5166_g1_i2.p1 GENE.c5166_g1_i2~~c5166_g1_i2.p1  ORF type:complete len:183 (+),score=56.60 c5166_g1_i2:282-830(+)
MINLFDVKAMIFTGVAGALKTDLNIGDIVIASGMINYDMDVTAFKLPWDPTYQHKRGEIPFLSWREHKADDTLLELAAKAPHPDAVPCRSGLIASGSEFLSAERKAELRPVWESVDNPEAVEMEGAAVAQICRAYSVPFLALRAISDTLTGDANSDFNAFCDQAADNVWPIVAYVVREYKFE